MSLFEHSRCDMAALVPAFRAVHDPDDGQHHRHLDQHTDHGGEGGAGLEAEQAMAVATASSKKLEAPISADGPGHAMPFAELPVQR